MVSTKMKINLNEVERKQIIKEILGEQITAEIKSIRKVKKKFKLEMVEQKILDGHELK